MASIADRWHVTDVQGRKVRTDRYGSGKRWQVRYRDPAGASRNRSFERRADAERFLTSIAAELLRGEYVDPRAGLTTFETFAETWLDRQTFDATSRAAVELRIRCHMKPTWGTVALARIRPADVQVWLRALQLTLAPSYVRLILVNYSAILSAAVEDGLIARNPCKAASVRPPSVPPKRVTPWSQARVASVLRAVPERYRALVATAAAAGLRQGECFGLREQDVDLVRGELHVRQQIRLVAGRPERSLPKYGRTRTVPIPEWLGVMLDEHRAQLEPLAGDRSEVPGLGGLLFYSRERKALNRNYFNTAIWRPALDEAAVPRGRDAGMHALRHFCASTWLEHGVSIKAVSEYLGHADPGFTLRVYTHVMPSSDDKARAAHASLTA